MEQTLLDFLETSPAVLLPNGGPGPATQPLWATVSSCVRGRVRGALGTPAPLSTEVVCRNHIPGVGLEGWVESEASGLVWVVLNEGTGQMNRGSQQSVGRSQGRGPGKAELGVGGGEEGIRAPS